MVVQNIIYTKLDFYAYIQIRVVMNYPGEEEMSQFISKKLVEIECMRMVNYVMCNDWDTSGHILLFKFSC